MVWGIGIQYLISDFWRRVRRELSELALFPRDVLRLWMSESMCELYEDGHRLYSTKCECEGIVGVSAVLLVCCWMFM
jgi:hypothetical protein